MNYGVELWKISLSTCYLLNSSLSDKRKIKVWVKVYRKLGTPLGQTKKQRAKPQDRMNDSPRNQAY